MISEDFSFTIPEVLQTSRLAFFGDFDLYEWLGLTTVGEPLCVACVLGGGAQKEWEDISQVNNINPAKRTPSIKVLEIWLVLLNNQRVMLIESSTFKSFLPRRVVKSNIFFLCDRSCMMILMLSPASHIFWYILIVGLRFPSLKVRKLWSRKKGQRNPGWRPGGWFDSEYPQKKSWHMHFGKFVRFKTWLGICWVETSWLQIWGISGHTGPQVYSV